jgi:pseudouridine synthase
MAMERIQKILAHSGVASRRAAEQMMLEGRVTVNGEVIDRLGAQADPEHDHIKVDGRRLKLHAGSRSYLLAFKPREMITTMSDPEGRPTIVDLLREHGIRKRVYPVGRLDWDADGLLLLTDDGELANKVMHPRSHLPKVYQVRLKGNPSERDLERIRRGIVLEPGLRTLPAEVAVEAEEESGTRLRITLIEGRQNQIKRMFERIGHPVRRLRRVQIGPLRLGKMKPGELRSLTARELEQLQAVLSGERLVRIPKVVTTSRPQRVRSRPSERDSAKSARPNPKAVAKSAGRPRTKRPKPRGTA